jgi:hypothetical protein
MLVRLEIDAGVQMIPEILADARKVMNCINAEIPQMLGVAYPRQFEQLRAV